MNKPRNGEYRSAVYATEIMAEEVEFLGGGQGAQGTGRNPNRYDGTR